MRVARADRCHAVAYAALRHALWPDQDIDDHVGEVKGLVGAKYDDQLALVALDDDGSPFGFAEASIRQDYVNGCGDPPVAFLEGVYVTPDHRRQGAGKALVAAAEAWAAALGYPEMASDAELANEASHRFHAALGYEETERVVFFRKFL